MDHTENGTKFNGRSCPHCNSEDLEPQVITIIGGKATEINYWCNFCGEMAGSYVEGEYV